MKRCALFVGFFVGTLLVLEGVFRLAHDTLFDASYRALFKVALLRQQGEPAIVFYGTSRTGEALRPGAFVAGLQPETRARYPSAFNVSVQFSSLEVLDDIVARSLAQKPQVAVIELSRQQLKRAPLEWPAHPGAVVPHPAVPEEVGDADARAFAWLQSHSALVQLRKSLVLDCFARFLGVALFGRAFDGSEQMGVDYARSLFSHRVLPPPAPLDAAPVDITGPDTSLTTFADEATIYTALKERFTAQGSRVVFFVPPSRGADSFETDAVHQAAFAAVAARTGTHVLDFSGVHFADDDFRDNTHMSHKGGARLSALFAERFIEAAR